MIKSIFYVKKVCKLKIGFFYFAYLRFPYEEAIELNEQNRMVRKQCASLQFTYFFQDICIIYNI